MKNWLRITFAVDPQLLADGLERTKSFCQRHGNIKEDNSSIILLDLLMQQSNHSLKVPWKMTWVLVYNV
ncbi:hypothetical protein E2562_034443 [Oryza meyeriana var. granulata]|uniref:Uncharacterized protein n=1 Tax=Oryza meyeriana var. granulata TaxID=110450 RepID=A0A6G1FF66_9ORYZ|nr:hypothetical protein E2562_034443 [Oryza meyeriana var. granulata]